MKKIVFSIFIDIPENKLDNPGWFKDGIQVKTDKSLKTKQALLANYSNIIANHKQYADTIGVDYRLYEYDDLYKRFSTLFQLQYTEISEYDIVNFYKHHIMYELTKEYDEICYLDFDVVVNTKESVFEVHDIYNKFGCANSNKLAEWGKKIPAKQYNTCIRNPATKYWNAHAMLEDQGYDSENNVFNTGIMVASAKVIKELGYFNNFKENLNIMTRLKNDEDSFYPYNIRRVFGYDNETLFSYLIHSKNISVQYLNGPWHTIVDERYENMNQVPSAKLYHFINKKMEWMFE